jgi:threonine dehydratase
MTPTQDPPGGAGQASRLSLERIEAAARSIDPVFLHTPQFSSDALGDELGCEVVLKVETVNPIRSFKGRGADFFAAQLPADAPPLVCASAGNFGQGLAHAARRRGLRLVVFAAQTANPLKLQRMRRLGADVRLAGDDFDAAKDHARAFAAGGGGLFVEDGREPAIAEGAGTIAVELCRWPAPLDFILVPVGNGALLAGVGRWMKARSPATRVVGVCAAAAPSMALSLQQGKMVTTQSADTIADGIAVRVPVPEALDDLATVVDEMLLVEDAALVEAMRAVFRHHGLVVEPSGAAGLAAAMTYRERFRGARVATPLCGGNMTAEQVRRWLLSD